MILYGSGMGESTNTHSRLDVPTILVGGNRGNRHIKAPNPDAPLLLMLSIANKFGDETGKFGLSTGKLEMLTLLLTQSNT